MIQSIFANTAKCVLTILIIFITVTANAAAIPEWQIIPDESSITFTGTQNNAPVSGNFKKFTGVINVDPNQLNASKVHIIIDMNSVSTSYSDLTSTLITPDWFDIKLFPQAIFEATHFTKTGDNKYQANGMLTIRDKTLPVTLAFTAEELSKTKVRVTGNTTLQRIAFGVGQGEWSDTTAVKNDVQVNFIITAIKK